MATTLKVGDTVWLRYGPYQSTGEVVAITDAGAVIEPRYNAVLRGYDDVIHAPDGTALTTDRAQDFIGRAHWDSVNVVKERI